MRLELKWLEVGAQEVVPYNKQAGDENEVGEHQHKPENHLCKFELQRLLNFTAALVSLTDECSAFAAVFWPSGPMGTSSP